MSLEPLPIDTVLPDLLAALRAAPSCVLRAPTGAGKTTRVPPALWDAQLSGGKQVVVLEPRRVAAQAAARRMAAERGATLGEEVGYQVRFEKKAGRNTKILVVTEGLFLRMLQDDPFLERVGAVIFDEFHERSLDVDLALAMARKVQAEVRADLKLLVMSATLDVGPLAAYLGDCPTIDSPGRQFAVEVRYLQHPPTGYLEETAAEAIEKLLAETPGDVLAFFPGVGEIRRAERALGSRLPSNVEVLALYGDLPLAEQQAVLEPSSRRKVVLATNVAETSLTIPGVTAVVDTGLARTLRLDPRVGLDRLDVGRISQASAEQRTGRAGRTVPGVCQRLWLAREQAGLAARTEPEIQRVDLAGPALQLLAWGEADLASFPWFESPPATSLAQAQRLLEQLGAVADGKITGLGQRMARFPAHPRIARLLCEAERLGHAERIALAGALLAERDPFSRPRDGARRSAGWSESDVLDRVVALEAYEAGGERAGDQGLDRGAARFILRARDQWVRLLREDTDSRQSARNSDPDEAVLRALVAAFPDRIARRREPRSLRAAMVGGRGVRLWERSAVREPELFVCVEVEETGQSEALARQASAVERAWIPAHRLKATTDVEFDPARERVVAWRRTRCDDLILDEAATSIPPDVDAGAVLARAAAERLDLSTLLGETEQSFVARAASLRIWRPELELPDLGEDPLRPLLAELCSGWLSFADVRKAGALSALRSGFTPAQLASLDREAPERLTTPSGSSIQLEYAVGKPPVLAVRIQEVFGWRETPRIANGRVRVLLHLLGPNYRPQQITDDLESFWSRTYPEVRKELRRRYPKHSWPEDPWTAVAQRRPGKRS